MAALDFPASPSLNDVYSANGRSWIWNGTTWNPYGSGIADGDRGDITVSNNGATWTVDDEVVTYAKIQNVSAASRLLGRGSASGAGDVEEISIGSGLSMTGTTLAATVTDTGITQLTGDVTAGPGSGSQVATIPNNTVTFAKMQDISTQHFIGRHTSGSGDPEQIGLDGGLEFQGANIRRSALTGDVTASAGSNTTTIANGAVTYAKMQDVSAASRLIGRGSASGSGDPEEITLGSGLTMTGTTLSASGGGGATPIYAEITTDWSTTDNTSLQDITGLAAAMAANTDYEVKAYLIYTTTATTTGLSLGVSGPASPDMVNLHGFIYRAFNVTPNSGNAQAYGQLVVNTNGSATNAGAIIEGVIRNGANAGNLQLQGRVETAVAGTLTIKANSCLILTPI